MNREIHFHNREIEWQDVAHELVWSLQQLEETPTDIKTWKRIWRTLEKYEDLCRRYG